MANETGSLRPYLKTLKLLCVDSSITILGIYEGLFTILFKEIIFAQTAEEGFEKFEETNPDLIITEHSFTSMSGMEMIKKIRDKNTSIPIILSSSFQNVDILTQAIHYKIHNFIKKPFETTDLLDSIENGVRLLLADKYIQDNIDYSSSQETLAFQKEFKILRNDYYYKYLSLDSKSSFLLVDFLYKAKDILSGDSYSARKIKSRNFLFLIDGMGKGIPASLSAIVAIAFINRILDNIIERNEDLNLDVIISRTIKSIQTILFEDEILSATFVVFDSKEHLLQYASFSMPPILLMDTDNKVLPIKSNNPPISIYGNKFKIDEIEMLNINKMLIYSDGLVENSTKEGNSTYAQYVKNDFMLSVTREDFRKRVMEKIDEQEDDITFIFLNEINTENKIASLVVNSSLEEIENAGDWFDSIISKRCNKKAQIAAASLAFNELILNAYEHGNLNLTSNQKHKLIADDRYFDFLEEKTLTCKKKITIDISEIENLEQEKYLVVKIEDEGLGFDTKILADIFGINKNFNHRGVLMSRNSTIGIYYNDKANKVVFISKI